ncbi:hypothetical protein RDWZM_000241 [Blomia tropicalis]|uniref:Uncharacterized protein n=1 Tax=Blomia tropicalis TaxID=40697 RepID=A0A9Q0RQA1_BLOTA|nr:hypothetical protein RDWZM_000241 [Blomia tropicalis]
MAFELTFTSLIDSIIYHRRHMDDIGFWHQAIGGEDGIGDANADEKSSMCKQIGLLLVVS